MKVPTDLPCRREFLIKTAQSAAALVASASVASASPGPRISYFCNGEIHVNEVGKECSQGNKSSKTQRIVGARETELVERGNEQKIVEQRRDADDQQGRPPTCVKCRA